MGDTHELHIRLDKSIVEQIDQSCVEANCKTRNEFIEKAVVFYMGYVFSEKHNDYLSKAVIASFKGFLDARERKANNIIFKFAVELGVLTRIFAQAYEVNPVFLDKVYGEVVNDLKRTNCYLSFRDEAEKCQD